MSYQVFARKYRPQVFDDVLGQDHVVQTLKNAILQRRLAHAYLFVGPRGTGKTSTARILAKGLNCVHGPTPNPCGVCDSCREIAQGISLDVLEIDGASNNSVDQIRELRDNVRFAPVRGRYKLYIIDEVHMLSTQAFNALLKTLEEPPEHVIFVFATTEVHKVLPTILSRCQRFDLRRIPTQVIARHLAFIAEQENVRLSQPAAEAIAVAADGGLRDAESMLDQLVAFCGQDVGEKEVLEVFGLTSERVVIDIFRAIITRNAAEALALIDRQAEAGKDFGRLLADLLVFARSLLVFKVDPAALRDEVSEAARAALEQLHPQLETGELLRLIQQLAETESVLKWSANKRMHLEIGVIRAVQSLEEVGLDSVLEALQDLRSSGQPGGKAPAPARKARPAAPKPAAQPSPATPPAERRPVAEKVPAAITAADGGTPAGERGPAKIIPAAEVQPQPQAAAEPAGTGPRREAGPEGGKEAAPRAEDPAIPQSQDPAQAPPEGEWPLQEFWPRFLTEIRSKRPLILSWVEKAVPLGIEDGVFRLGLPEGEALTLESLTRANNRKFIENILAELLGRPHRLEAEIRPGLEPLPAAARVEADSGAAFKNDPLIQKALEIFRAEIQAAEPG
ncbi:MAG: DNA polymerase III subunit gamma/tau [Verrucomicrobia bacterium]|nr:DNA polymerase III subunit gamma/tau [Verrucomicrobiota bacterium]